MVASHLTLWYRRPRSSGWKHCRSATAGSARWCSAASARAPPAQRRHALVRRAEGLEQPEGARRCSRAATARRRGQVRRGRPLRTKHAGPVHAVVSAARRPAAHLRARRRRRAATAASWIWTLGDRDGALRVGGVDVHARGLREPSGSGDRRAARRRSAGHARLQRAARRPAAPRTCSRRRRAHAARPGRRRTSIRTTTIATTPVAVPRRTAACASRRTWRADGGDVAWITTAARRGADEVMLLLGAATSFNGYDQSPSAARPGSAALAGARLRAAAREVWAALRDAHVADHRALLERVDPRASAADAARRRRRCRPTSGSPGRRADPALVELLFQYGRYLLIASSRPGTQPANLQGIWNDQLRPPWSSNYTININTQMNYWPAESDQPRRAAPSRCSTSSPSSR